MRISSVGSSGRREEEQTGEWEEDFPENLAEINLLKIRRRIREVKGISLKISYRYFPIQMRVYAGLVIKTKEEITKNILNQLGPRRGCET